ncbi:hypothetical protein ACFSHT_16450 [Paraburkholderia silviterrae]|uniref:Uncharacterized protein n=1 Tax=Paraburkholderia silviterrae TaxID=2528715 RepID=A0A4R5M9D0_9BURK|nr:hypothetical protein [Paraburkholderia silviterrae]TDG23125.1 hypothetical protein EYW47_14365 [Paraburkholderia silviterrae]
MPILLEIAAEKNNANQRTTARKASVIITVFDIRFARCPRPCTSRLHQQDFKSGGSKQVKGSQFAEAICKFAAQATLLLRVHLAEIAGKHSRCILPTEQILRRALMANPDRDKKLDDGIT